MRTWLNGQTMTHLLHEDVVDERQRALDLHGMQHLGPEWWLAILTEEVGEFAEAILDLRIATERPPRRRISSTQPDDADVIAALYAHIRDELVQCAAVCLSALSDLDGHYAHPELTKSVVVCFPEVDDYADPARWWEKQPQRPTLGDVFRNLGEAMATAAAPALEASTTDTCTAVVVTQTPQQEGLDEFIARWRVERKAAQRAADAFRVDL